MATQETRAALEQAITAAAAAQDAAARAYATQLVATGDLIGAAVALLEEEPDPDPGPGPAPVIRLTISKVTSSTALATWTVDGTEPALWLIGRDGRDSKGSGPWSQAVDGDVREQPFGNLLPDTRYVITLVGTNLQPITAELTTLPAAPGPGPGSGPTAAERLGWGDPDPISDDFASGRIDPAKWSLPGVRGQGWPGHTGNGRRMPENALVENGVLVLRGDANGDTGWIRQNKVTTYGRWEIRSRSMNTGQTGGTYHPLHLIWPSPDRWPDNGELDFLEYTDPDSKTAGAWLHYPHRSGIAIQQEGPFTHACDMTAWHNFAFEWSRTGVRAWIDGEPWYEVKDGGGPLGRRNIQDMPAGSLTVQLDAFQRSGLRPARFEIDWVRFYPIR